MYNKIRNNQLQQPIIIRKPVNSKKSLVLSNSNIPVSHNSHGYSMTTWLWIDDWSYDYGKWKHVLHRGDENASIVQPGMWLHPTRNELYITFDTSNKQISSFGPYINNKVFVNQATGIQNLNIYPYANGGPLPTVKDGKDWCLKNPKCAGLDVVLTGINGEINDNTKMKLGIATDSNKNLKDIGLSAGQKNALEIEGVSIGSYNRDITGSTSLSMNPAVNANNINNSDMYTIIKDLPLGRWFNVGIVVNTNSAEVYIDGKLVKTTNLSSPFKENNGDLYISQNGGFSGLTTQLRYYNKPLSEYKIQHIYNRGPNPWMLPDLNKYFKNVTPNLQLGVSLGSHSLNVGTSNKSIN